KNTYVEREKAWLDRRRAASPRFKMLMYVHHVRTATALNPRTRGKDLGHEIQTMLGRLMIATARKIAKRSPDLFSAGKLESPKPLLRHALQSHAWTIQGLLDSERTLLLAACINAYKGRTGREKAARFERTLRGSSGDRRLERYR